VSLLKALSLLLLLPKLLLLLLKLLPPLKLLLLLLLLTLLLLPLLLLLLPLKLLLLLLLQLKRRSNLNREQFLKFVRPALVRDVFFPAIRPVKYRKKLCRISTDPYLCAPFRRLS
jgi:hypothetical protein